MGRNHRPQTEGAVYHVTARGNRRAPIFHNDLDRAALLGIYHDVATLMGWETYGFCLMTNHYHFVLQTREANIAAGMHRLNSRWARRYNRRYLFTGHVFERRYSSTLVTTDEQLLGAIRYVLLNPVRAGMCDHPSEWEWSSYNAVCGAAWAPDFLSGGAILQLFHPNQTIARGRFQAFVQASLDARRV
ncbi:MAG: transposase [Actinobacteria bacterium]|nr:transposase [Actinomycetota bacterium]